MIREETEGGVSLENEDRWFESLFWLDDDTSHVGFPPFLPLREYDPRGHTVHVVCVHTWLHNSNGPA